MTKEYFQALPAHEREELAKHTELLKKAKRLHPDEQMFLSEMRKLEAELGTLFQQ